MQNLKEPLNGVIILRLQSNLFKRSADKAGLYYNCITIYMKIYDLALSENGSPYLYLSQSHVHGNGVFTEVDLPAELILFKVDQTDVISQIPFKTFNNRLLNINHSCYPNVEFNEYHELISLHAIEKEEELVLDYSKIATDDSWNTY
jgi:hypothetical protein